MEQVLVSQTKDYLILKIPLRAVKKRRIFISDPEKVAILEGLTAIKKGEVSKQFDSAKEAISFLKKL